MISYSIDSTIFIPPVIKDAENEEQEIQLKNNITNYRKTIDKCHDLFIYHNRISEIYFFRCIKNNFDYAYEKKASNITGFPMDSIKKKLENILYMNYTKKEYIFDENVITKKYFFNDWFEIKNIDKSDCNLTPSLNDLITQDNELESRLIMIGILNKFVYKSPNSHFFIMNKNNSQISIESNLKKFNFLGKYYQNVFLKTQIKTKNIFSITNEPVKFLTVRNAYNTAKKRFANYLIFGKDVNAGIKTIEDTAGPPDRIFAYIETLRDFCIYKRNYNNAYDDVDILNVFGCICSPETPNDLKDQKVINKRMLDNGTGKKELFVLHLKPNTFNLQSNRKTVRIYFKWEEKQKKVIIGWIGMHLYLPPRT